MSLNTWECIRPVNSLEVAVSSYFMVTVGPPRADDQSDPRAHGASWSPSCACFRLAQGIQGWDMSSQLTKKLWMLSFGRHWESPAGDVAFS